MELTHTPSLAAPFDAALREAVVFLEQLPEQIVGIWLAGSVSRGEADTNSDLDLYVLVDGSNRRRMSRVFNGVPTEIFLNPPERARRYFDEDRAIGKRTSLAMMAEGVILYDPHGECAAIAADAAAVIASGPGVSPVQLDWRRYYVVDTLDNAADVAERDPTTARILVSTLLREAMNLWFIMRGEWAPRDKDLLPVIRRRVPQLAAEIDQVVAGLEFGAARRVVDSLIGVSSFFEWETPPEAS